MGCQLVSDMGSAIARKLGKFEPSPFVTPSRDGGVRGGGAFGELSAGGGAPGRGRGGERGRGGGRAPDGARGGLRRARGGSPSYQAW